MTIGYRLFAAALVLVGATPAFGTAYGSQPAREVARVEQTVRALGYYSWEEIVLGDRGWEVTDARRSDGTAHDLRLAPRSLRLLSTEPAQDSDDDDDDEGEPRRGPVPGL